MKKSVLIISLLLALSPAVWAQGCSVCTKTAAGLDDKSARGLNGGILYLALLPLGIMGTMGFIWWRSKNAE
jgi:hypothetical protein